MVLNFIMIRESDIVFTILLLAMMVPQVATMIPLFKLLSTGKTVKQRLGIYPSVYFNAVPDHDVPAEFEELPD